MNFMMVFVVPSFTRGAILIEIVECVQHEKPMAIF
jgi:hypothetical protein